MGQIPGAHFSLLEPRFLPADDLVELFGGNVAGWGRRLAPRSLLARREHFHLSGRIILQGSLQRRVRQSTSTLATDCGRAHLGARGVSLGLVLANPRRWGAVLDNAPGRSPRLGALRVHAS